MGWWKSEHGVIGDWPADILSEALEKIEQCYKTQARRLPTQGELADLIEFLTHGRLVPQCGDPNYPFSRDTATEEGEPRVRECGYQGIFGPAAAPKSAGELVNVDPKTGDHYEKGETQVVLEEHRKEAQRRCPDGGDLCGYDVETE